VEATPTAVAGGRTTTRVTGAPTALPEAATWTANPPAPESSASGLPAVETATPLSPSPGAKSEPSSASETPNLPAAVSRAQLVLLSAPDLAGDRIAAISAGTPLLLLGRSPDSIWVLVQVSSGIAGWCPASALDLNVGLTDLEVPAPTPSSTPTPTPTPSPTRTPIPTPTPSPAHAPTRTPKPTNPPKPTATPGPSWILVADSFADYPGSDETRHFWYLWSNGRNNFYWQDMKWDKSTWCYRGPVDWQLRICQDSVTADGRGDVSLLWKYGQGGTYRLEWDADSLLFYHHTNRVYSQGPGTRLAQSVVVQDMVEWDLFFWLARESTPYHILVFRLVQP
jgi:hypothetical protein